MPQERITSRQNPRVKELVRLRDRGPRDEAGLFLVEGYREILRALEKGVALAELYYAPEWFLGENEGALLDRAKASGAALFEMSRDAFEKAAYRERPDGLLAVAPQWKRTLADLDRILGGKKGQVEKVDPDKAGAGIRGQAAKTDPDKVGTGKKGQVEKVDPACAGSTFAQPDPFLLIVEAIEKPGNLGTMLRSADAAGCDAVIVCDPVTDLFNPNVVRASTGVLFSVPCVIEEGPAVLAWLRERRIRAVATTPAAAMLHSDALLRGPLAVVMGSEQYGLSEFWLKNADLTVRIPMAGQADSLNVAMAAIVTLFEAVRQRKGVGLKAGG